MEQIGMGIGKHGEICEENERVLNELFDGKKQSFWRKGSRKLFPSKQSSQKSHIVEVIAIPLFGSRCGHDASGDVRTRAESTTSNFHFRKLTNSVQCGTW
jgi:hypothetical protein